MNLMNGLKTFVLLSLLTGVLLAGGYLFGGPTGALVGLVFAGLMNFGAYWFSDKIVLSIYRARLVKPNEHPQLHAVVGRLAAQAKIPKPPIYIVNSASPNAFATGRSPKHAAVAVTTGIMGILTKEEIEAVLAHEIGHVVNRDTLVSTVAATLAGAITWLAQMASYALIFGSNRERGNAAGALFMMIVAPLAATVIKLAISRGREFGADEYGARLSQKPLKLASALEKISGAAAARPLGGDPATAHLFIINPLRGSDVASLFSTHPPTEERVRRLKEIARGLEK